MELIQTLGIEGKLLLAQIVNFAILLFVLWKVAYKPLTTLMTERAQKIQKGVDDAKQMDEQRTTWNREHQEMLVSARKQAQEVVAVAQAQSAEMITQAKTQAQQKIDTMMAEAQKVVKQEQRAAMVELEKSMTKLVVDVASKFLTKKMNAKDDETMIEQMAKSLHS
ncbi:F0F1 ATP synthase subunit B [Candidatus Uhrbacteria bacterium]|nr:F0F1 ATP synthase subunit B [Candidatus Uhrbacteria bacterium]